MERRKIGVTELKVEDLERKKLDVKYEAGGVNWKLFFDGEKSHLIAADCVLTEMLNVKEDSVERGDGGYGVFGILDREDLLDWMRDSINWEKFALGIPGAKATGGATVEQFCGCWNAMNQHKKIVDRDNDWFLLHNPSKLFVPNKEEQNRCLGYWLMSASPYNDEKLWNVLYIEMICPRDSSLDTSYYYDDCFRVRPLVSLPSDVGLEYDKDLEMWLIV